MGKFLHHFFFPHEANNHRAKALHLDVMMMYILAFGLLNIGLKFVSHRYPDVLGYATNIHVQELLNDTNQKRAEAGLAPLQLNEELSQAAAKKAADMFANNYWAHISPTGRTPWDFIINSGYQYTVAGENLAKNFQDSQGVVDAWMASPSHRENLLKSNYKDIGFAVVNGSLLGEQTTLVVQMFGTQSAPAIAQVKAAEPKAEPQLASAPPVEQVEQPAAPQAEKPVEVPQVASTTQNADTSPHTSFPASLTSVISVPTFDVTTVRRDITMLFAGMFIGILLVDLWVAARKHHVRAVGSTVAHVLFFLAILVSTNIVLHGSVL